MAELVSRLTAASNFTMSLTAAADGLMAAGEGASVIVAGLTSRSGLTDTVQALAADSPCVNKLVDGGLDRIDPLRGQLAAATAAIAQQLGPALADATAAITATTSPAPSGYTAAVEAVRRVAALVADVSGALGPFEQTVRGLPPARTPVSSSIKAVAALKAALPVFTTAAWVDGARLANRSVPAAVVAERGKAYDKLRDSLKNLQAAAAAAVGPLDAVVAPLTSLDTLYLGPQPQQQQQPTSSSTSSSSGGGGGASTVMVARGCMLSFAGNLSAFDSSVFRFRSALERSAIDTTLLITTSLERMYGMYPAPPPPSDEDESSDDGGRSPSLPPAAAAEQPPPLRLAVSAAQAREMLRPLAAIDVARLSYLLTGAQAAFLDPRGASVAPVMAEFQSALSAVLPLLARLQDGLTALASVLNLYTGGPNEDMLYESRIVADAKIQLATLSDLNAKLRDLSARYGQWLSELGEVAAVAAAPELREPLQALATSHLPNVTAWVAGGGGGAESLKRVEAAAGGIQAALGRALALLPPPAPPPPSAAANRSVTTGKGNATMAVAADATWPPSAFLQPLLPSVAVIARALGDGSTTAAVQLYIALGKPPTASPSPPPPPAPSPPAPANHSTPSPSSPPPPPSPGGQQSSAPPDSGGTAAGGPGPGPGPNVTASIQLEVVRRLDDIVRYVRGEPLRRRWTAIYWAGVTAYGMLMAASLLSTAALLRNWPGGLAMGLVGCLVLAAAMLVGGWAAAGGMVFVHDVCGSVDFRLAEAAPVALFPLARYYLMGIGGSLASVLRANGLGDTRRFAAALTTLQSDLLEPLLEPVPPSPASSSASTLWPGSLGDPQGGLATALLALSDLRADLTNRLRALLALGDRSAVLGQYRSVTGWGCCGLGEQLLLVWVCATGTGILAWLAALSAMLVLRRLDGLPGASLCGCTCYDVALFSSRNGWSRYDGSGGFYRPDAMAAAAAAPRMLLPPVLGSPLQSPFSRLPLPTWTLTALRSYVSGAFSSAGRRPPLRPLRTGRPMYPSTAAAFRGPGGGGGGGGGLSGGIGSLRGPPSQAFTSAGASDLGGGVPLHLFASRGAARPPYAPISAPHRPRPPLGSSSSNLSSVSALQPRY